MKGRRNVWTTLTNVMKKRLSVPGNKFGDLVDLIVEELRSENPTIDESFAIDTLSGLLFASFAPLSCTLTTTFKFLNDNPEVFDKLKVCIVL